MLSPPVLLDINLLGDVELVSEWKNLFLPPGHQSIVQAMVETHSTGKDGEKGMDLVRGKGKSQYSTDSLCGLLLSFREGKGCIILLHGVPGVGKTSTAGELALQLLCLEYSNIFSQNALLHIQKSPSIRLRAVGLVPLFLNPNLRNPIYGTN